MARAIHASVVTELQAAHIRPVYFFEGQFDSSYLRLWTGDFDVSWNSETWLGNGYLLPPEAIRETGELSAEGMQITLSGIPDSIMSLVLGETSERLTGKLWLGLLDANEDLIGDPILLFSGILDTPEINAGSQISTVRLGYESDLVTLETARGGRYTDEYQQNLFPGDLGFSFMVALQSWSGVWIQRKSVRPNDVGRRRRGR